MDRSRSTSPSTDDRRSVSETGTTLVETGTTTADQQVRIESTSPDGLSSSCGSIEVMPAGSMGSSLFPSQLAERFEAMTGRKLTDPVVLGAAGAGTLLLLRLRR